MSSNQINILKRQKAFAWAKYYEEQNKTHERVVNVVSQMNNFQDDLPLHLLNEFEEMASALKVETNGRMSCVFRGDSIWTS